MTKSTPSKSKSKKPWPPAMQTTIIVAILGCVGTTLGAVVSGIFMYMTTRAQIDLPVAFTQTAQFQPTAVPGPTQQVTTFDWKTILSIDHEAVCPAFYAPDYLFAGGDKFSWVADNLANAYSNDELMYAPNSLWNSTAGKIAPHITITSSPNNQKWIILSNKLTVSIHYIGDAPSVSEVMQFGGCGGGGSYRHFSSVPLNIDYPVYNVVSTSTDADFFTLQPGELEVFVLEFQCRSPGLYAVEIRIPVTILGNDETVVYTDFPGIHCPDQFNYNHINPSLDSPDKLEIYDVEQYEWTGQGYQKTNP